MGSGITLRMKRLAALAAARAALRAALCSSLLGLLAALAPAPAPAAIPAPVLPVTGAGLIAAGGQQLWSYRGDSELAIASTTKIMTFLVVLQHLPDLQTVLTQNDWDAQPADSQIGLEPGERMTAINLLYALMLPSADDAAEDLAYNVGRGSLSRFISWMNADASKLGLRHTHYTTPIGLDTAGNYSSPDDLAHLADYMTRRYAVFRRIVHASSTSVWNAEHTRAYRLVNTNDLLTRYPWIDGVKTGHTALAGYVLVSEGTQDGLTLIASVLGTSSEYERDQSTLALLHWGFSNFVKDTAVRAGQVFARSRVPYQVLPAVVVAAHSYVTVIVAGTRVRVTVGHLRDLAPPMAAGTDVGYLKVQIPGHPTVRVPLVLEHALPAVATIKKVAHDLVRPITLLLLALMVGAVTVALALGSRRRRRRDTTRSRVRATRQLEER